MCFRKPFQNYSWQYSDSLFSTGNSQIITLHISIINEKTISILLFALISVLCFSQENDLGNNQKNFLGIVGGLNFSKLSNDTIALSYGTKPAIGFYCKHTLNENFSIKSSIIYSIKGSLSTSPFLKLENTYFDFSIVPQYKLVNDFFYIETGITFSNLVFSQRVINDSHKWNGIKKINTNGFNSEFSIVTGLEMKLQNNFSIDFNYFIPLSKGNTQNFQLSLNILLTNRKSIKESYRHIKQRKSAEQIRQLKSGTLLVRLKSSENKINALINTGEPKKATKVKEQQDLENKKIVSAFKKNFNFCNAAFFYDKNSEEILNRNFVNIFLNDSLKLDSSILIDTTKPLFTAEFAAIEQDTAKSFSHYSYRHDENGRLQKVENYYTSSSDIDFLALVIKDQHFIQLNKPFPYYTRTIYKSIKKHPEEMLFISPLYVTFLTWSYDKTIKRMNKKLSRYYNRNLY
jgi:hypothetical protein